MGLKLKKNVKRNFILLAGVLCIVVMMFFVFRLFNKPNIQFKKNQIDIEINEKLADPLTYIEKVNGKYKESDIKIDSSQVNTKKLGEYKIKYTLNDKEYDLLVYFITNKGLAISREQVLNKVWDENYYGSDRVVDDTLRRLRKKMPEINVRTIYGFGYRLD